MITFTEKGAEKVQEFLATQSADIQTSGLRVGVRGGGCSGFQYALAFDTQRDGDEVFEDHGLRILVDTPEPALRQGRGRRLRRGPPGRRLQGRQPERHRGLRLRLLLPRRGGGRGLRRLGGRPHPLPTHRRRGRRSRAGRHRLRRTRTSRDPARAGDPDRHRTAAPTEAPAPAPTPEPLWKSLETRGKRVAVGISEQNPNFVSPSPDIPQPFARWRDALGEDAPGALPPRRLLALDPAERRTRPPTSTRSTAAACATSRRAPATSACATSSRALAARQTEGGWEGFVVITGTPEWAARPPSGCERRRTGPTNRMPRTDALRAYERLVARHRSRRPARRAPRCATGRRGTSPTTRTPPRRSAPRRAARPSRASRPGRTWRSPTRSRRALRKAPGDQRYVLGEVAVMVRRLSITTTVNEFLDALPARAGVRRPRVDAAHLHRRRGRARRRRRAAEGQGLRRHADLDDRDRRGRAAHRDRAHRRPPGRAARLPQRGPDPQDAGTATRASPPRSSTRCARTTCSRPGSSRPTSRAPIPALKEWQQWGLRARERPEDPPPSAPRCG